MHPQQRSLLYWATAAGATAAGATAPINAR